MISCFTQYILKKKTFTVHGSIWCIFFILCNSNLWTFWFQEKKNKTLQLIDPFSFTHCNMILIQYNTTLREQRAKTQLLFRPFLKDRISLKMLANIEAFFLIQHCFFFQWKENFLLVNSSLNLVLENRHNWFNEKNSDSKLCFH